MKLYIVRHAEAEDHAPSMHDFDRALTARGMKQAKALGQLFEREDEPATMRPDLLLASPAVRAVQTATLIASAMKLHLTIDSRLGLDADVKNAAELVRACIDGGAKAAMIVGHNPTLEDLAAMLGAGMGLKKAECVVIKVELKGKELVGKNARRARPEE